MTTEALADLVEAGLSDVEISELLGVSSRTVLRWRKRDRLPSRWTPTPPSHGTDARYRRGCRCKPCKAAHATGQRTYRRSLAYARWRAGKGPHTA
jgi:hypothetical protein